MAVTTLSPTFLSSALANLVFMAVPVGDIDGINTVFGTPGDVPYVPGQVQVVYNTTTLDERDVTEGPTPYQVTLSFAPQVGDAVRLNYVRAV